MSLFKPINLEPSASFCFSLFLSFTEKEYQNGVQLTCQFLMIFYGPKEAPGVKELGQKSPEPSTRDPETPPDVKPTAKIPVKTETPKKNPRSEVPPPQASVDTRNQSSPSPAPCRRGPSSPEAMEEDLGGDIIAMKAKDQRGKAMEEEAHGGEPLLLSLGGTGVPSGGESALR